jgi:hypothetical protein
MANDEVQAAVDALAERLQRSVVIDDPSVRMLYSSRHFGDEDPARVRAMLQRDAGSKAIGHLLAQGVSAWTTAGVIPSNEELGIRARVCVPIRWRGEFLGMLLVIDAEGSVTTTELATMSDVARDLAPVLAARQGDDASRAMRDKIVLDLVAREPAVRRQAIADLAPCGELERFTTVTAVELGLKASGDASAAHVEAALRHAVGMRYPQESAAALSAVTSDTALLLLGSSAPLAEKAVRSHARRMLDRVGDLAAGRFDVAAGVGSSAEGIDRAAESARQARLAYRAAVTVLHADVATWTELGAYGPLLQIPEDELNLWALPAEVQRLLNVDRGQHLTETLRAYLDHGCSGPQASEALHIHRTTLYYRLGRIAELTGLDLSDGRVRLALHLGLTMIGMIDTKPQH